MNHLGTKTLETERLTLRPFKETDVENMSVSIDESINKVKEALKDIK